MNKKILHGILFGAGASFWWGVIGVFYFKSVAFVGQIELVIHRTIWTAFLLLITTTLYSKWSAIRLILKNQKKTLLLLTTGILIFTNWSTWVYIGLQRPVCKPMWFTTGFTLVDSGLQTR